MKRLPMRKIREALRLRADGFSGRQVAQSLAVGRATISEYFRRADVEGLRWPLPADLSDAELERRLFPYSRGEARRAVPQPDWAYVHAELRRKGVTLSLLWEEYRGVHPDGYGYSRYCELYTSWEGKLSPVMRQRHPAGERLFVDYAGQTVDVICPKTGEVRTAQIFVAALGASNYTYVEASWTQSLSDWTSSHVRAFEFFGGVTAQLVSDNLKAGVTKACFYDPAINRTYGDMASHYDTAIVPARPKKPKDKAKVEAAVLLAERWILDALKKAGCEKIYVETASGAHRERPQLAAALNYLREGDTLVIWKLSRLARSLKLVIKTAQDMNSRSIALKVLTQNIDTGTPEGRLFFHMTAAFDEFQRELIVENTRAGLAAAQKRGRRGGRPPVMDENKIRNVEAMLKDTENYPFIGDVIPTAPRFDSRGFPRAA